MADLSRFLTAAVPSNMNSGGPEHNLNQSTPQPGSAMLLQQPLLTPSQIQAGNQNPGLLNPSSLFSPPIPQPTSDAQPDSGALPSDFASARSAQAGENANSSHSSGGGIALSRGESTHVIGPESTLQKKNPRVTAITIYNTEPGYRLGRLVAVTMGYIIYGVRAGSIRVIHQATGDRMLLKGHTTSELADISICGEGDECALASLSKDGELFVWSMSRLVTPETKEIVATPLYPPSGVEVDDKQQEFRRVMWHPHQRILCVGGGDRYGVKLWQWDADAAPGSLPRCTDLCPPAGDAVWLGGAVNDISWSPGGGELAVADAAGNVTVYSFSAAGDGAAIDTRSWRLRAQWRPFDGAPVQSVLFAAPGGGGGGFAGGGSSSRGRPVIITGAAGNRTLKLWDHSCGKCLHTFRFEAPAAEAFQGILALDPLGDFLIIANTVANAANANAGGSVYTLHLRYGGSGGGGGGGDGDEAWFDCLSEFAVVYPVLSCAVRRDPTAGEPESPAAGLSDHRAGREMQLYCLQTKAIQQYHLPPAHCYDIGPLPAPEPFPMLLTSTSSAAAGGEKRAASASAPAAEPALAANGPGAAAHEDTAVAAVTAAPPSAPAVGDPAAAAAAEPNAAVKRFMHEALLASAAAAHGSLPPAAAAAPNGDEPAAAAAASTPVPAGAAPAAGDAGADAAGAGSAAAAAAGQVAALGGGGVGLEALRGVVEEAVRAAVAQSQATVLGKVEADAAKRRAKDKDDQKRTADALAARVAAAVDDRMSRLEERLCAAVADAAQREARSAVQAALPAALEGYFKSSAHWEQGRAALAPAVAAGVVSKVEQAIKASGEKTAQGVCQGIRPLLNESFTSSFEGSIIPAFESSCQIMFDQMKGAFDRGLAQPAEGVAALEAGTRRLQGQFGELQTMVGQAAEAQQRLQQGVEAQLKLQRQHVQLLERAHAAAAAATPPSPAAAPPPAAAPAAAHLATAASGVSARPIPPSAERAAAAAPAAAAPADDPRAGGAAAAAAAGGRGGQRETEELAARLTGLLRSERYEEAFSQVLSLSDLQLVTWLCQSVKPARLFGGAGAGAGGRPPAPLSSPVVLSLVQQLAFDLSSHTRLKVEWLREATLQLNRRDPLVSTHIVNIVRDLHLKLLAMERGREQGPSAGADAVPPADMRALLQTCSELLS